MNGLYIYIFLRCLHHDPPSREETNGRTTKNSRSLTPSKALEGNTFCGSLQACNERAARPMVEYHVSTHSWDHLPISRLQDHRCLRQGKIQQVPANLRKRTMKQSETQFFIYIDASVRRVSLEASSSGTDKPLLGPLRQYLITYPRHNALQCLVSS